MAERALAATRGERPLAVVLLAGGKGTRMQSDALPKVLQEVCGLSLLGYALRVARSLAPVHIVTVVGFRREMITARCAAERDIVWAVQEPQLGTGHAARVGLEALPGFEGDVLILNADLPHLQPATVAALLEDHRRRDAGGTILVCHMTDPTGYGRILRDGGNVPRDVVEERDATPEIRAIREVNAGLYVYRAGILRTLLDRIRPDNAQGEYYLTDAFRLLAAGGGAAGTFVLEDETEIQQISTRGDLAQSARRIFLDTAAWHMARGVTIVSPETTFIDQEVAIGPDTVILPFCVIRRGVRIGARCEVGPFTHLRSGAVLEDGAEVGNFTEMKNAVLGVGSKAKHLSYIGDGRIGAGVNIGAGTVFANYDGKKKHMTVVEDGAFVGSGSILVAPVRVGARAVTGAGAVVTRGRDVAPGQVVAGVPARPLVTARGDAPRTDP